MCRLREEAAIQRSRLRFRPYILAIWPWWDIRGEMFVDYQLFLDDASPFDRTIALGYTNGCIGYVPTADAYPVGGYEVEQAFKYYGTLMIGAECEDMIKTTTVDMLKEKV